MPSLNFTYEIPRILTGVKRTTIRPYTIKYQRMNVGCSLSMFTGMRTKYCLRLGSSMLAHKDVMTPARLFHLIHHDPLFVMLDGFDDPETMDKFFEGYQPNMPDYFVRLMWEYLDRCDVIYKGVYYRKAMIRPATQQTLEEQMVK